MSTPTTDEMLSDPDVIDLEPTFTMEMAGFGGSSAAGSYQPGAVALAEGTLASLVGETETLRRSRLFAASVFLAATYALLADLDLRQPQPRHARRRRQSLFTPVLHARAALPARDCCRGPARQRGTANAQAAPRG